jgi:signal peptidase I
MPPRPPARTRLPRRLRPSRATGAPSCWGLAAQAFATGDLSGAPELTKALRTGEVKPWDNASPAMSPTLLPDDRVLAWNWAYRGAPIRRGDVVAFTPTRSAQRFCGGPPAVFIKRVIGLPGDRVIATRREVRVNGRPQVVKGAAAPGYSMSWPKLGPGQLVLLGDNRSNSCDSHVFGSQPASRIWARSWASTFRSTERASC